MTAMERRPKSGELYRHFKNKLYQIVTIAKHSETGEELVIYQALYGNYQTYARPLEMFVSEVDHVKYPDVVQKYRFEKVERESLAGSAPVEKDTCDNKSAVQKEAVPERQSVVNEETVDARVMEFLDTEDFDMRYNILVSMRDDITDMQINTLAVALDVVIPEGELQDRYEQLKMCLRTRQRYESSRLR